VWTYEYDHENRLTVATNGALRIDYRYDAFGRLIERRTCGSSVTTNRLYYAGWQLIAEYNGAGTLQRKYVYGPGLDEPVRMRFTGGVGTNNYYHADGLGSVTEITTNGGFKVESYTYDVYGTPTIYNASAIPVSQSAIANRLVFTARDRDPDTTLYNYRYRYYSPSLGRFVQVDPVRLAGGDINLYAYVYDDPINGFDPYGLMAWYDRWLENSANFAAGWGDALTSVPLTDFSLIGASRKGFGIDYRVDRCSDAYGAGHGFGTLHALTLGGGRVAYAGAAKVGSMRLLGRGATAENAAKAIAYRNRLKSLFNLAMVDKSKMLTMEKALKRYDTFEEIIKASGRTDAGWNTLGVTLLGVGVNSACHDPCK